MISAPVQFNPVETDAGFGTLKSGRSEQNEKPADEFSRVFDTVTERSKSKPPGREAEAAENAADREADTLPPKEEAEKSVKDMKAEKDGAEKNGTAVSKKKTENKSERADSEKKESDGKKVNASERKASEADENLAVLFSGKQILKPEETKKSSAEFVSRGSIAKGGLKIRTGEESVKSQLDALLKDSGKAAASGRIVQFVKSDKADVEKTDKKSRIKIDADELKTAAGKKQGINPLSAEAAPDAKDLKLKKTGSGDDKAKIRITDHRKNHDTAKQVSADKNSFTEKIDANEVKTDSAKAVIELNAETAERSTSSGPSSVKSRAETVLTQLKEGVNAQIVKQAGIVVKENGTGEIKLVMKPESLGKVRIQLSLNDNHIGGRIIVENNTVRQIFESNLENLYKAFGTEGFEAGALEVTVEGDGSSDSRQSSGKGSGRRIVQMIEDSIPDAGIDSWQDNLVNLVV